jgi:hypothetical protein
MPPKPKSPFDDWPVPDFYAPDYGFAWMCEGGLVVSHAEATWGHEAGVAGYLEFEDRVLERYRTEIAAAGGLYVIHDWRAVTGYDSGARMHWQEQLRKRPKGYLRGSTVCVTKVAPLLKMAVQAANLVASLTQSARVDLATDLDQVLAQHRPIPRRSARGRSGPPQAAS